MPKSYCKSFVLMAVLTSLAAGCAGSSRLMSEVPKANAKILPSSEAATVVFARDSGLGFGVNFLIVDQEGRFIGEAVAKTHFAIQVPPGEYLFIAEGENTDVVQASVAAGTVYYIHVIPHMGAFSAHVELDPIKPTEAKWQELSQLLAETERLAPIVAKGQAQIDSDPEEKLENVQDGKDAWNELSKQEQVAHTIAPQDGKGPAQAPVGPTPSTPDT